MPPGFFLRQASIDKPLEEDACRCHFTFDQDSELRIAEPLVLKYQWFLGERTLSNFVPIPDATDEVISCYSIVAAWNFICQLIFV